VQLDFIVRKHRMIIAVCGKLMGRAPQVSAGVQNGDRRYV